jgi:hypothetical protein
MRSVKKYWVKTHPDAFHPQPPNQILQTTTDLPLPPAATPAPSAPRLPPRARAPSTQALRPDPRTSRRPCSILPRRWPERPPLLSPPAGPSSAATLEFRRPPRPSPAPRRPGLHPLPCFGHPGLPAHPPVACGLPCRPIPKSPLPFVEFPYPQFCARHFLILIDLCRFSWHGRGTAGELPLFLLKIAHPAKALSLVYWDAVNVDFEAVQMD